MPTRTKSQTHLKTFSGKPAPSWAEVFAEFFALCLMLLCFVCIGNATDWIGRAIGLLGVAVCSAVLWRIAGRIDG